MVEREFIAGQELLISDFGTVEGITAPHPKVAVAIALRAYPAGKHADYKDVKFNKKTKHWSVHFGWRR